MSELSLIAGIQSHNHDHHALALGIGDDCAVLESHPLRALVTSDSLMDGVHFKISELSPEQIANKALGVNLSDIAAMGGVPEHIILSTCWPASTEPQFIQRFHRHLGDLCRRYGCAWAGGDTNVWEHPLVLTITAYGRCHPRGPVLRSGAQVGDWILVTGPLGGSIHGHHYRFTPRLDMARRLLDTCPINSMIDLSDGLATDLRHILRASNCGASLFADRLPPRVEIQSLPVNVQRDHILTDGEDFELCFTVDPGSAQLLTDWPELHHIGYIESSPGLRWHGGEDITLGGYEHRLTSAEV